MLKKWGKKTRLTNIKCNNTLISKIKILLMGILIGNRRTSFPQLTGGEWGSVCVSKRVTQLT